VGGGAGELRLQAQLRVEHAVEDLVVAGREQLGDQHLRTPLDHGATALRLRGG